MKKKQTISRKTQKIILGICIAAVLILGIGLFAYIHMVDSTTLGRKISIYGLDVSKMTVEEAQQKIADTFQSKAVVFEEDGGEVYRTSLKDLGYALDEENLKSALDALQQERSQETEILASQKDYQI